MYHNGDVMNTEGYSYDENTRMVTIKNTSFSTFSIACDKPGTVTLTPADVDEIPWKDNTAGGISAIIKGKAAFKIWGDIRLAPNGTSELTDKAKALAESIRVNNTFSSNLDRTCAVADFFGKTVAF